MVDDRIPLSKTLIDLRIKELELEEKARVIYELKSRQDEASIRQLVEKFTDDSWHLRQLAVRGLSEIGPAVEQPVMEILPGSLWFTRACAAEVLGNIKSRTGIDVLIGLLDDCNGTVRERASKALLQICAAGDAVWVARAAVSRGEETVKKIQALLEKHRKELAEVFVSIAGNVDLMKAPVDQVERMTAEMLETSDAHDLVWEELTGSEGMAAGRSDGKSKEETIEGGGEAGEQRSI